MRSSGGLHYLQAGIIELSLYRGSINIDYLYIFASVVAMKVHNIVIIVAKMVDVCGCVLNLFVNRRGFLLRLIDCAVVTC